MLLKRFAEDGAAAAPAGRDNDADEAKRIEEKAEKDLRDAGRRPRSMAATGPRPRSSSSSAAAAVLLPRKRAD